MNCLDQTLPTPAANLACDEALLDACEEQTGGEVLRFWEPRDYFVVVGYSNHVALEVDIRTCRREQVGVYRRCSGGGTVLQGPGCLNYSLILKIEGHNPLQNISATNHFIMGRHRDALSAILGRPIRMQGHTDLSLGGLKFSGNAQRRKRHALIFHGTFLLGFDLSLMEKFLPMPSRQPDYREDRPHRLFLTNLPAPASAVKDVLRQTWSAGAVLDVLPDYQHLIVEKYSRDDWNWKL
ncbi:MAG: lipoate--protein ligase family protein [Verrucomicrobiota bacterium]|jgi:lipoate-protein ligase A